MRNFLRGVILKVLYPLLMLAGAFAKDRKEKLQMVVIDLNNRLVRAEPERYRTKRILLLLPHCLQINDCDVRITNDIYNCKRPEAIVAVACERDLSSGIVDIYPLPVIGIPNERPFGPCVNTKVDLSKVKEAIEFFGKQ